MSLSLYERVALKRDLSEADLKRGDVAVLVDRVQHPSGGEPGCVLEVFNALGESIAVIAVAESDIEGSDRTRSSRFVPSPRLGKADPGTPPALSSSTG